MVRLNIAEGKTLKIYSNHIKSGYFHQDIGNCGQHMHKHKPTYSFHLGWQDLPVGTKSLALVFLDHDAIPVCGFTWIHWTIANIDPAQHELTENASIEKDLLEGMTSWGSEILPPEWKLSPEEGIGFGGCAPPDKPHQYTIELYALDKKLNLQRGFYFNELLHAMEGHILDKAVLQAMYKNK